MGEEVAISAATLGARIIEKHVKLKGDTKSLDSKFSMDTENFKAFCKKINMTWETLGTNDLNLRKDKSSRKFRRSIYVVKNIKKGQYIDNLNIKKIRPSNGLHPKYYFKILGKKVKKNIYAGTPMKLNYIS